MSPVHSAAQAKQLASELACELSTRAAAADVNAKLPVEDIAALRSAGFCALSVPRARGGSGLTLAECLAIQIELAQGSAATAMVLGMPLHIFGSASEHCPWLPTAFEKGQESLLFMSTLASNSVDEFLNDQGGKVKLLVLIDASNSEFISVLKRHFDAILVMERVDSTESNVHCSFCKSHGGNARLEQSYQVLFS